MKRCKIQVINCELRIANCPCLGDCSGPSGAWGLFGGDRSGLGNETWDCEDLCQAGSKSSEGDWWESLVVGRSGLGARRWGVLVTEKALQVLPNLSPVTDNSVRANYLRGLIVVFAETSSSDMVTTRLTLDEYRAMEQTSPERHEYRNGEIITMSGGSEAHSA